MRQENSWYGPLSEAWRKYPNFPGCINYLWTLATSSTIASSKHCVVDGQTQRAWVRNFVLDIAMSLPSWPQSFLLYESEGLSKIQRNRAEALPRQWLNKRKRQNTREQLQQMFVAGHVPPDLHNTLYPSTVLIRITPKVYWHEKVYRHVYITRTGG